MKKKPMKVYSGLSSAYRKASLPTLELEPLLWIAGSILLEAPRHSLDVHQMPFWSFLSFHPGLCLLSAELWPCLGVPRGWHSLANCLQCSHEARDTPR
jgi:hypothetical protein